MPGSGLGMCGAGFSFQCKGLGQEFCRIQGLADCKVLPELSSLSSKSLNPKP